MPHDHPQLADRIRAALAKEASTREVHMFGGLSFMVNTKMVVATQKDGGLLVRVDPERSQSLLALPGAEPAEMGAGRTMGPGWIRVDGGALTTDDDLSFWIGAALERNSHTSSRTRHSP